MTRSKDGLRRALHGALLGAFAAAMAALGPAPAHAAEVCISKEAADRLAECPGGKFDVKLTKKPGHAYSSAPPPRGGATDKNITKPINPTDIAKTAQRDERQSRLTKKSRRLLLTEIKNVESLYKTTPKKSPDRPQLMRRLAEGYVELESAAFRDKIESDVKAQDLKKKNPKQAAAARQSGKKAEQILAVARKNSISYYLKLKQEYATWCQFPKHKDPSKRGCTDEVLYYLAYEYEQAGQLKDARDSYLELIENWKDSRFVPNAFLAFGELFFNAAQADPSQWPLAEKAYRNVVKYKPPENKLYGYARYKLAYVLWNTGRFDLAIDEFKQVIEFGEGFPQLPNAAGIADSARRDIIPVYALKGDPKKAYDFFKPLSGDKGVSNEKTFKMMEFLGTTLLDTGHYPEAIVLYEDLMRRNKGDNYCQYQARISECVLAYKSGTKEPIVQELGEQLNVHLEFKKDNHSPQSKLECANSSASLLSETAMAWHLEAVGSGGVRGTGDPKTMTAAEGLYENVVKNFTVEEFKKFSFPRIVKEDWPTIPKIRYAMADLLYFQKKWDKCGPAFDAVVADDPRGPNAPEAAFASVLCYQNIYAQKHADGSHRKGIGEAPTAGDKREAKAEEKFTPKEFSTEQKGMLTAFNRYVCYITPPEGDKDAAEQYTEVKFARARTYFEAQHWDEAAAGFRDVALNHATQSAGIFASQLYLEALNVLGSRVKPPRPACYDDMERDVPKFIELYCRGDKAKENEEQCTILFRIQRDIERLKAEMMVKKADATTGPERIALHEQAGNAYLELWKKYGEGPCEQEKPGCERNEEILYNAARAFQAARLVAKAITIRRILIDPKYHLDKTEPARKAVYEIGGNYQAIAVYDLAAKWYEQFAGDNPRMEKAPDALSDSVVLRLGLGQQDQAIKDAQLFNRLYGAKNPAKAAQIAFAIGAWYVEHEDWRNAERNLKGAMAQIDRAGSPDVQIEAHALLGRVYKNQRNVGQADSEYKQVLGFWSDPAKQIKKLDELGGSQAVKDRRVQKTVNAVGEALYHFAEKKRAAVEGIKFPEYKGKGEREDLLKHINTKVKDWMDKKGPAIKEAEAEYLKILDLKPKSPRWVIAAGAAVGDMWGRYVEEFRKAPHPKEWDQKGESPFGEPGNPDAPPLLWSEILAHYNATLDEKSEKEKKQAKAAYVKCLDYSVSYQYFDQDSRSCEEWLSKKYPGEFHLIDEFRGSATRVNSGLDERPQPLNMDGTPVVEDTRKAEEEAAAKEGPKLEAAGVEEQKKPEKGKKK
ncbi:MAG: tetratricopeptide repeat protein [Deltaproteobacteria bacterium]|nr:tetratricopeptide repeat protein [Deltaproteobacteria bacterium]